MSLLESRSSWTFKRQREKCQCYLRWTSSKLLLDEIKATIKRSVDTPSTSISLSEEASSFPFMELPIEIRIMIYRQHFHQPRYAFKGSELCPAGNLCRFAIYNVNVPVGKLITVSKCVYNEAMPIYFGEKEFKCLNVRCMRRFLTYLGPIQRNHIRHICFDIWSDYDVSSQEQGVHDTFQLLSQCTRLRRLEIPREELYSYATDAVFTKTISALTDCLSKNHRITRHDTSSFRYEEKYQLAVGAIVKTTLELAKKEHPAVPDLADQESVPGVARTGFSRPAPETRDSSNHVPAEEPLWQSCPVLQPCINEYPDGPEEDDDDELEDDPHLELPRIYNNFT